MAYAAMILPRVLTLIGILIITGPCILLVPDVLTHGLTSGVPNYLVPTVCVYLFWCVAGVARSRFEPAVGWWEYVILFGSSCVVIYYSVLLGSLLGAALPAGPSFKSDSLRAYLMLLYVPWLLLQYAAFVVIHVRATRST